MTIENIINLDFVSDKTQIAISIYHKDSHWSTKVGNWFDDHILQCINDQTINNNAIEFTYDIKKDAIYIRVNVEVEK